MQEDIKKIESININEIEKFRNENKEWIEDVNRRLEEYMQPSVYLRDSASLEKEKQEKLSNLFGYEEFSLNRSDATGMSYYFVWENFGTRNGWRSHNMEPRAATRLLRYMAQDGWNKLSAKYSTIRNDNGSLSNQYWCHWDYVGGIEWNIEIGRPIDSGLEMIRIRTRCNPV